MASSDGNAAAENPRTMDVWLAMKQNLPPVEVWPLEEDGDEAAGGDTLPDSFMTREQARASNKFDPEVWKEIDSVVWDSVVQVVVPKTKCRAGKTVLTVGKSSGFVTFGPGVVKKVLTNYHVLDRYRGNLNDYKRDPPISVKFFFDTPNEVGVEMSEVTCIEYYSINRGCEKKVDGDNCDFAMLIVENIPQNIKGIPLSTGGKRKLQVFEAQGRPISREGIIVGHPKRSHKRVTIVHLDFDDDEFIQKYSEEGTKGGSSGSPVVINARTSASTAYFLHRHSGGGIDAPKVIQSTAKQATTFMETHSQQMKTKFQIK